MITLREASIEDLSLLKHWDQQQHNIDADPNDDWEWETELLRRPPWREQLVAELDGRPLGFLQIIDPLEEETHYWGAISPNRRAIDIWIGEAEDLGKGHGTIMMKLALERCFAEEKVEAVLIDPLISNERACRFYEKIGFTFLERRRFGEDDCYVYQLDRSSYLASVTTP